MYLTALTRRDRLFDVATRWLSGQVEPGDAQFISEVFLGRSPFWTEGATHDLPVYS